MNNDETSKLTYNERKEKFFTEKFDELCEMKDSNIRIQLSFTPHNDINMRQSVEATINTHQIIEAKLINLDMPRYVAQEVIEQLLIGFNKEEYELLFNN